MSEQSAFKSENILAATTGKRGLLEELHLPPQAIAFIRRNQQLLLAAVVIGVAAIVGWNWYSQYSANREDQAAALLTRAMEAQEPAQRRALLAEVRQKYGRTDAALLSGIEEAHLAYAGGDLVAAVGGYEAALQAMGSTNPLQPLVQLELAQIHADQKNYDKAMVLLEKLQGTAGFAGVANLALGRVHALAGNPAKAREALEKVIALENVYPPLREAAQAQLGLL
ncbi:MAG: tetratricopeptide repeat protein [Thermodesulfobacteriota bacterium]